MPDFNPNDMDALFREGAERHEFEYNSDAWALMEQKLDKKESKRKIIFYLLGFLLLAAVVGSYSYLNSNTQISEEDISINSQVAESEIEAENVNENEIPSNNLSEIDSPSEINQIETKEYISTDSKVSRSNIGAQNSFQSESTGNLIGNEIVSAASQNKANESINKNHDPSSIAAPIIVDNILKEFETKDALKVLSFASLNQKNTELFDLGNREFDLNKLKPSSYIKPLLSIKNANRFALTIFANPEWSSVGLFQESKAGWSVGAKIGYQFSDKFELSTGVAYSRKIYKGGGDAYNMQGGWYDIAPQRMDAKCDVIEIPIAFSYYMNGYKNSGFFVDLGVNSYMLHSEWYGFEYDDALTRPEEYVEVIEEDQNKHLVGVGRFSIGYQKILSNNTSFQIAPYLQLPLTGIGAGRVNLYSSGVQIAVKFNTQ